jgi:thioesterase domain-containing protein
LKDRLQELQETFHREIPITKQLGITVENYNGEQLTLKAPIGANINHKHTAFAGSINSLVTLAGWGLLWLMLKELDIAANIIIQDSTCNYLRPVTRDFSASCRKPDPVDINKFEKTLRTRGKARLELLSEIHEAGKAVVSFKGRYVIHLS